MNSLSEFFQLMRQSSMMAMEEMLKLTWGEVSTYDPQTHSARFTLPLHVDDNGNPIETASLPLGTPFSGVNYGMQFPIETGMQALIAFLDGPHIIPLGVVFLFNNVDIPPFIDGKTNGWKDKTGNFVKTTVDGKTANDGKGGVRLGGGDYLSAVVTGLIELGQEGMSNPEGVVRYKDLKVVVDALNAFVNVYNNHQHSGVTAGSANTAVPTSTANTTTTQASQNVYAKD